MLTQDWFPSAEECEVARQAVENELISRREARVSLLGRGNGLVVREKDHTESSTIRMGMEEAIMIAVRAVVEHNLSKLCR